MKRKCNFQSFFLGIALLTGWAFVTSNLIVLLNLYDSALWTMISSYSFLVGMSAIVAFAVIQVWKMWKDKHNCE